MSQAYCNAVNRLLSASENDRLVRKEAILVNILHIRMLIKANTIILFDAIGTTDSALLQSFVEDLSVCNERVLRISG